MARSLSTLLHSPEPCAASPARVTIGHVQLRDVVICPHQKGIVTYPQDRSILEHDILSPDSGPRPLAELGFTPNSLSSLNLPNSDDTLLAAGGQEAELYLSLFSSSSSSSSSSARTKDGPACSPRRGFGRKQWESKYTVEHASINKQNNSVLLTSLSLTGSHQSSAEPRVVISNNDKTVKFFDVSVRRSKGDGLPRLVDAGLLALDVPVNHSSISPDGRTLLCVGDSSDVYLHRITGGSRITVSPIATLSLAPYLQYVMPAAFSPNSSTLTVPAAFSTAFSADGSKFAVASQEGAVVVWDVRSTKPLKVFQTDKSRPSRGGSPGSLSWLFDGPLDWSKAPGWGVRSIKFSPAGVGREVMTFTEHTSLFHVVDARTFETEEIIRMPNFDAPPATQPLSPRPRSISPTIRSRSSAEPLPPPPPRIVLFSGALEETFRIPSEGHPRRRPRAGRRFMSSEDVSADDDVDSIVLIPPLGDRRIEDDVRRLLGRHGLRTRRAVLDREHNEDDGMDNEDTRQMGEGIGEEMDVDVDELESDCFSSHTPSRAPSPVPALQPAAARSSDHLRVTRPGLLARRESSGSYNPPRRVASGVSRRRRRSGQAEAAADVDQDLAGTCFDPTGTRVYVASVKGVAEWAVRGAEQRWWTDPSWA